MSKGFSRYVFRETMILAGLGYALKPAQTVKVEDDQ